MSDQEDGEPATAGAPDRRRGRPAYVPTDEHRRIVAGMRAAGALVSEIAAAIGVSLPTLRAAFPMELVERPATGPDLFSTARPDAAGAEVLPVQPKPAKPRRKGAGGRPKHEPTRQTRERVQVLTAAGMTQAEIALALGISEPTLRKAYAADLSGGSAVKRAELMERLWRAAMAGNVTAMREMMGLIDQAAPDGRQAEAGKPSDCPAEAGARRPEATGKKMQALDDARSVLTDSPWAHLINPKGDPTLQ